MIWNTLSYYVYVCVRERLFRRMTKTIYKKLIPSSGICFTPICRLAVALIFVTTFILI